MSRQVFDIRCDGDSIPMLHDPNKGTIELAPIPMNELKIPMIEGDDAVDDNEDAEARPSDELKAKKAALKGTAKGDGEGDEGAINVDDDESGGTNEIKGEEEGFETVDKAITSIEFPSVAPKAVSQGIRICVTDVRIPPGYNDDPEKGDVNKVRYAPYTPIEMLFPLDTVFIVVLLPIAAKVRIFSRQKDQDGNIVKSDELIIFPKNSPQMPSGITISYLDSMPVKSPIPETIQVPETEPRNIEGYWEGEDVPPEPEPEENADGHLTFNSAETSAHRADADEIENADKGNAPPASDFVMAPNPQ